jgi:hypothetical protein
MSNAEPADVVAFAAALTRPASRAVPLAVGTPSTNHPTTNRKRSNR